MTTQENENIRGELNGPRISRLAHIFLIPFMLLQLLSNPVMTEMEFPTRPLQEFRVMFREEKSYQELTSIKCLLFARHFSKHFTWIDSFNSHCTPMRYTISPPYF